MEGLPIGLVTGGHPPMMKGFNNHAALIFGFASTVVARSYGRVLRAVSEITLCDG